MILIKNILIIFLLTQIIYAQSADLDFQHFTTADGLVTNWMIRCPIVQDAQGFIWIGSDHGLHKYDGYKFTVFTHDENDSTSISNNSINDMHVDRKGRLWIGTKSGLNKWQPETESFKHYFLSDNKDSNAVIIYQIREDNNGNLQLVTNKDGRSFNPDTETFQSNRFDFDRILGVSPSAGYLDKNGIIWFAGENIIARYNPSTSEVKRYDLRKAKFNNNSNILIRVITEDLSGRLLIGGKNCLYYFDRDKESIECLRNLKNNSLKIFTPEASRNVTVYYAGYVNYIFQSPTTKEYWIGAEIAGVNRFDASGKLIHHYNDDFSHTIFEDKSGVLWLGSTTNGIFKANSSASNFEPQGYGFDELNILSGQHILGVIEDNSGNLWIGTSNGNLYKYNFISKKLKEYSYKTGNAKGLGSGQINFVFEDKKNRIWVGTYSGLSLYNPKTDSFTTYYVDPGDKYGVNNYFVSSYEDNDGNLTFGIWSTTENYTRYYSFSLDEITGEGKFTYNANYSIDFDLKNNGGKLKKISENESSKYLPNFSAHSYIEDKNGIVWSGASEGLVKYNPLNHQFKLFTTKDGLPVNTMGGILEDDDGYLWVANSAGVLKVNPDDDSFIHFGKDDGLTNNLFEEYKAAYKSKGGLLFFGGFNGLTVIDPKRFKANTVKPEVQITGIKIFGESIPITKDGILKKSISFTQQLELEYNQNDITLNFVGLHYKNPKRNKYAYKLEPYEKEWKYVDNIRDAHYTNLSAGEYTFYVKASNSDGVWNEEGKQLAIIINPPPWATWWAYAIYFFAFVGILGGIRKFELDRRKEKENKKLLQLENDRKTKELEEARQLQLSMLPKTIPSLAHLDIGVYMKTATEVGGDYYDFNVGLDGILTVAIGDATGHGMQAGTIVSMAKALFASGGSKLDMKTYFNQSSDALKEIELGRLMMAFLMIKINNDKLEICNAGMPPLFIYKKQSNKVDEILLKGMPLGAIKNFPYEIIKTDLSSGDTILLLSDGLPELKNDNNKQFGYERVKESFAQAADKQPEEIISYLKEEGSRWANDKDPDDDVTFVVIKVK
jgi:serine phosphatase RsbU (regulator of sigma subunit)/ligand-binding sensor domain-containing protein